MTRRARDDRSVVMPDLIRHPASFASVLRRDLAAPRTRLGPAPLEQLLEPLQVALRRELHATKHAADLFVRALRLIPQPQLHARLVLAKLVESHRAAVARAAGA